MNSYRVRDEPIHVTPMVSWNIPRALGLPNCEPLGAKLLRQLPFTLHRFVAPARASRRHKFRAEPDGLPPEDGAVSAASLVLLEPLVYRQRRHAYIKTRRSFCRSWVSLSEAAIVPNIRLQLDDVNRAGGGFERAQGRVSGAFSHVRVRVGQSANSALSAIRYRATVTCLEKIRAPPKAGWKDARDERESAAPKAATKRPER